MTLTPHTRQIIEDLSSITSNIVVKRPDIALENENDESIDLYYSYKDIKENGVTDTTFDKVPTSVSSEVIGWKKSVDPGYKPVKNEGKRTLVDGQIVYTYRRPPTYIDQVEVDALWCYLIGAERYSKIYNYDRYEPIVEFNLTIGNAVYHTKPSSIIFVDDVTKTKVTPIYKKIFLPTTEVNPTGDYGISYTKYGNNKYSYDPGIGKYYVNNTDGEYYLYYYNTFVYIDPIVTTPDVYLTTEQYSLIEYGYQRVDSYVYRLIDGRYVPVTTSEEASKIGPYETVYIRCNEIQNETTNTINTSVGSTASFSALTYTEEEFSSIYYFDFSKTGDHYYDSTLDKYIKITDPDITGDYRAVRVTNINNLDRYSYTGGVYVEDPNGNFTFTCKDVKWFKPHSTFGYETIKMSTLIGSEKKAVQNAMKEYVINSYCPDVSKMDYRVPLYIGETNNYYRMLNGLPPTNKVLSSPKVDRYLVNPSYSGDNPNPYVWELTDSEVDVYISKGYMEKTKSVYTNDEYLNYIGKNRIDVIQAREAMSFAILRLGDCENTSSINLFRTNYEKSLKYILQRYYTPDTFGDYNGYISVISFLIMITAMLLCIVESENDLIYNKGTEESTVNEILKSYNYYDTFNNMSFLYKKMLSRKIAELIKKRGTDEIFPVIFKILGRSGYQVYKYDMYNNKTDIIVEKSALYESEDQSDFTSEAVQDILGNLSNLLGSSNNSSANDAALIANLKKINRVRVDYDDLIFGDNKWYAIKNDILKSDFYEAATKYIDVEAYFDIAQLTINNSYILNYINDICSTRNVMLDVANIGSYDVSKCIASLFAIESLKYGLNGYIPSTLIPVTAVSKFDIEQAMDDTEVKNILNSYVSRVYGSPRTNIQNLITKLNTTSSIKIPDYSCTTIRSIYQQYEETIKNKTASNGNVYSSFLNDVIDLKNKSDDIEETHCYDEILKCIATANIVKDNYSLTNPIWEPIFTGRYTGSGTITAGIHTTIPFIVGINGYDYSKYTSPIWFYFNDQYLDDVEHLVDISLLDTSKVSFTYITDTAGNRIAIKFIGTTSPTIMEEQFFSANKFYYTCIDGENDTHINMTVYERNNDKWSKVCESKYNKTTYQRTNTWSYPYTESNNPMIADPDIWNPSRYESGFNLLKNIPSKNIYVYYGTGSAESIKIRTMTQFPRFPQYCNYIPGSSNPNLFDVTLFQYCDNAITYNMYIREECPELYNEIFKVSIDGVDYIVDVYDTLLSIRTNYVYTQRDYISANNIYSLEYGSHGTVNITVGDVSYTVNSQNSISTIRFPSGTEISYNDYYKTISANADAVYNKIITAIENRISEDSIKENYVLSQNSAVLIIEYLKLLVNTFKSYMAELRNASIRFIYDNIDNDKLTIFDSITKVIASLGYEDNFKFTDFMSIVRNSTLSEGEDDYEGD